MLEALGIPPPPALPSTRHLSSFCHRVQPNTLDPFSTASSDLAFSSPSPALIHSCPNACCAESLAAGPLGVMSAPTSPFASAETPAQAGPDVVSGALGLTAEERDATRGGEPDRRV